VLDRDAFQRFYITYSGFCIAASQHVKTDVQLDDTLALDKDLSSRRWGPRGVAIWLLPPSIYRIHYCGSSSTIRTKIG
jgi:hypothetical protein